MSGIQSASYPEECKNRVKAYISYITEREAGPLVPKIIDNLQTDTEKQIFADRTYTQVALDEIIGVTQTLMQDISDKSRILPAYHELMKARYGENTSLDTAKKHLEEGCEKTKNNELFPLDYIPAHIAILAGNIPQEEFSGNVRTWLHLSQDIAYTVNDNKDQLQKIEQRYKKLEENVKEDLEIFLEELYTEDFQLEDANNQESGNGKTSIQKTKSLLGTLLDTYGEDVTEKAKETNTDICFRDNETRQAMAILLKEKTPYALCVGGSGAGKTSVVDGIANAIVDGNVPEKLKDSRIIRLKIRDMKASSGQGQILDPITGGAAIADLFMSRFHDLLKGVSEHNTKNKEQIILDIDELGTMGDRLPVFQAKNVLAAAMDDYPNLRIIGEISDLDFHSLQQEAPKMVERFQQVRVLPLDTEQTLSLLKGKIAGTGLQNTEEAILKRIIQLTNRFTPTVKQPGASLDILDSARSYAELDGTELTEDHIAQVISERASVPKEFIGSSISERISTLGEKLPNMVLGQDNAIKKIIGSMKVANAGLKDPNKPLGSYMLVGPTGVGKTETAKALAESLGVPLITEDMSNYREQHAKAKLVGSPPGYVGYQDKAALEKVAESPYCVLLLDEIEKAHGDVFNVLLSVLDEGRVQLMNGKNVDFKNCIILMTSNLGEKDAQDAKEQNTIGFTTSTEEDQKKEMEQKADDVREKAIKDRLPPEFINRLDGILKYNALQIEVARNIAVQKVAKVSAFLQDKNQNLSLEISEKAMDQLVSTGYDERYGARPMDRAIKDLIKEPLAEWIVENGASITEPTTLYVKNVENTFDVKIKKAANGPAPKA